jgi:hypothetical protein
MSNIISYWNKFSSLVEDFFPPIVIGEIIFNGELGNLEPNVLNNKT